MYGVDDSQFLSSHEFKPKGVTLYGAAHLYPVPTMRLSNIEAT
jgi:hypothetical protein